MTEHWHFWTEAFQLCMLAVSRIQNVTSTREGTSFTFIVLKEIWSSSDYFLMLNNHHCFSFATVHPSWPWTHHFTSKCLFLFKGYGWTSCLVNTHLTCKHICTCKGKVKWEAGWEWSRLKLGLGWIKGELGVVMAPAKSSKPHCHFK